MIRLIVSDLDRTLLHTDKSISEFTLETLARCREKGIKLVLATARPLRTSLPIALLTDADALIVHNGAGIYMDGELTQRAGIAPSEARALLTAFSRENPDATLSVEMGDVLYANFDIPLVDWAWTHSDFTDLPDIPADKLLVGLSSPSEVSRYARHLPPHLYIEPSAGEHCLGLVMHRAATKWLALCDLLPRLQISPAETAALGDDLNDLDLLKNVAYGVAVSNAVPAVLSATHFTCPCSDLDGVARWLSHELEL